jgi:hypothetical protein
VGMREGELDASCCSEPLREGPGERDGGVGELTGVRRGIREGPGEDGPVCRGPGLPDVDVGNDAFVVCTLSSLVGVKSRMARAGASSNPIPATPASSPSSSFDSRRSRPISPGHSSAMDGRGTAKLPLVLRLGRGEDPLSKGDE